MRKKIKALEHKAVIPTASMADIAFLLIIFFMLTITFEVDKTQVALPKAAIRKEVPKKAAYISITKEGVVRVSGGDEISTVVPLETVSSFALEVTSIDPNKEFVLKADKEVPYRLVDEVIDALKQAQVKVVYLLSEAKPVEEQ